MNRVGAFLVVALILIGFRFASRMGGIAAQRRADDRAATPPPAHFSEDARTLATKQSEKFDRFPDEFGDWSKLDVTKFKDNAGRAIAYECDHPVTATIYIYNGGLKEIRTGNTSLEIFTAYFQAKQDIVEVHKQVGNTVKLMSEGTFSLVPNSTGLRMKRAIYEIQHTDGQIAISQLLITASGNNIVKIRFTYPQTSREDCETAIAEFLRHFNAFMTE